MGIRKDRRARPKQTNDRAVCWESQIIEQLPKQSVLFEAVATAPANDKFLKKILHIQRWHDPVFMQVQAFKRHRGNVCPYQPIQRFAVMIDRPVKSDAFQVLIDLLFVHIAISPFLLSSVFPFVTYGRTTPAGSVYPDRPDQFRSISGCDPSACRM